MFEESIRQYLPCTTLARSDELRLSASVRRRSRLTRSICRAGERAIHTTGSRNQTTDSSPGPSTSSQVIGSRSPLPLRTTVQTVARLAKGSAAAEMALPAPAWVPLSPSRAILPVASTFHLIKRTSPSLLMTDVSNPYGRAIGATSWTLPARPSPPTILEIVVPSPVASNGMSSRSSLSSRHTTTRCPEGC
jgi:hypothetical protein